MNLSDKSKETAAIAFLALNHAIGLTGMHLGPFSSLVTSLTWLNLLLSLLVVLWFSGKPDLKKGLFYVFVFAVGMIAEITGVNTGFPFGDYSYPPLLGIQLMGVPLIIGANWLLLALCTRALVQRFTANKMLLTIVSAALMVGLDFLLEPFAVDHGLWVWHTNHLPGPENYLAWFGVGVLIQWAASGLDFNTNRPPVEAYTWILLLFLLSDRGIHLLLPV